jgi:hypothetical protein
VAAFIKLTPAQQDHAGELANLGCTGHSLNLTAHAHGALYFCIMYVSAI